MESIKPIIKWVGGKTQLMQDILDLIPPQIDCFVDLFVGGGSVFMSVLATRKVSHLIINDTNRVLIELYKHIKNDPSKLIDRLCHYFDAYNSQPDLDSRSMFYYEMRDAYNTYTDDAHINKCAMFVLINRTCFRGVHRVGPHGFNVPFGHYKSDMFVDVDNIMKLHSLLNQVPTDITCLDFENVSIPDRSVVYVDPPYYPLSKRSSKMPSKMCTAPSFVKYNEDGFTINDQQRLAQYCHQLSKINGNRLIISNSNVEPVRHLYSDFSIKVVVARRRINSKHPESIAEELLITSDTSDNQPTVTTVEHSV